jgi:hypothetical protein
LIVLLAAAQAVMSVSAAPGPILPPVTSGYSIVIARAVSQSDPKSIACGAANCTSWFLGKFDQARNIAGEPLPATFDARIEMGIPFISRNVLAMIVESMGDGTYRVRAAQGFHYQTKLACFDFSNTETLTPQPTGERLVRQGRQLCIK